MRPPLRKNPAWGGCELHMLLQSRRRYSLVVPDDMLRLAIVALGGESSPGRAGNCKNCQSDDMFTKHSATPFLKSTAAVDRRRHSASPGMAQYASRLSR